MRGRAGGPPPERGVNCMAGREAGHLAEDGDGEHQHQVDTGHLEEKS